MPRTTHAPPRRRAPSRPHPAWLPLLLLAQPGPATATEARGALAVGATVPAPACVAGAGGVRCSGPHPVGPVPHGAATAPHGALLAPPGTPLPGAATPAGIDRAAPGTALLVVVY